MISRSRYRSAAAAALALALAGCGGVDGIELNGGLFDMLGVSDKGTAIKDPKVPERTGLVLPPDPSRLPAPGSSAQQGQQQVAANPQWPTDVDDSRRAGQSQRQRQHAEYCEREIQRSRAMRELTLPMGPLGRCEASLLTSTSGGQKNIGETLQGEHPKGLPR